MLTEKTLSTAEIIIKASCLHFGITVDFLTANKSLDQHSAYQRFVCMYLIRQKTILNRELIGALFNRGGNAVSNAFNRIVELLSIKDGRVIADLKEIQALIDKFTIEKKQSYS